MQHLYSVWKIQDNAAKLVLNTNTVKDKLSAVDVSGLFKRHGIAGDSRLWSCKLEDGVFVKYSDENSPIYLVCPDGWLDSHGVIATVKRFNKASKGSRKMRNIIQNPTTATAIDGKYRVYQDGAKLMEVEAENWMDARRAVARVVSGMNFGIRYTAKNGTKQYRFISGDISKYRDTTVLKLAKDDLPVNAVKFPRKGKREKLWDAVLRVNPFLRKTPSASLAPLLSVSDGEVFGYICAALIDHGWSVALKRRNGLRQRIDELRAEIEAAENELKEIDSDVLVA